MYVVAHNIRLHEESIPFKHVRFERPLRFTDFSLMQYGVKSRITMRCRNQLPLLYGEKGSLRRMELRRLKLGA
jgi:hypothetical protein